MTSIDAPTVLVLPYPAEELPESGIPARIEHGCDYMLTPDGNFEFHYNFLDYFWLDGAGEIRARHYLKDGDEHVSVYVARQRLQTDATLRPLVLYLLRRYRCIRSFEADSPDPYQVAIRAGKPERTQ